MSDAHASGSVVARLGGDEAAGQVIFDLVDRFYDRLQTDPTVGGLFPTDPAEFAAAKRHQALFILQYFGGPATYSAERGHPRLRMRHLPFPVDTAARDAWVGHMATSLAETDAIPAPIRQEMMDYFKAAATFMRNR